MSLAETVPFPVRVPPDLDMISLLPMAIYTTDADGYITFFNEAAAQFWGRQPRLGQERWCGAWRLYGVDGEPILAGECPLARTLKTGEPVRGIETLLEREDGSRAFFLPYPTPLRDASGRITGAINMLVDITGRKHAEQAAQHLAAVVESSDDAIISKNLNGIIQTWNSGAERLFGYTAREAIGRHVSLLIPQDRLNEEPGIIQRIRKGERIDHYETIRQRKDGSLVNISLTVSPVKDDSGTVIGASKIARDVTERKRAEQSKEILLNEIKHRVKNTLATVQAIASQTFRAAPPEERDAFTARLRAMAGAHDLLTRRDWGDIDAGEAIERALAPFRDQTRERLRIEGPSAKLNPNQALLLSMVMHELATNAVKYGALSNTVGEVDLGWTTDGSRLKLIWAEQGGPAVAPPQHKGFGSLLIERALHQEKGEARFDFLPGGLVCTLEMAL